MSDRVTVEARAGRGIPVRVEVRPGASVLMVMWAAYFAAKDMVHSSLGNLVNQLRPGAGIHASVYQPILAKVDGREIGNVRTSSETVGGGEEVAFHL